MKRNQRWYCCASQVRNGSGKIVDHGAAAGRRNRRRSGSAQPRLILRVESPGPRARLNAPASEAGRLSGRPARGFFQPSMIAASCRAGQGVSRRCPSGQDQLPSIRPHPGRRCRGDGEVRTSAPPIFPRARRQQLQQNSLTRCRARAIPYRLVLGQQRRHRRGARLHLARGPVGWKVTGQDLVSAAAVSVVRRCADSPAAGSGRGPCRCRARPGSAPAPPAPQDRLALLGGQPVEMGQAAPPWRAQTKGWRRPASKASELAESSSNLAQWGGRGISGLGAVGLLKVCSSIVRTAQLGRRSGVFWER